MLRIWDVYPGSRILIFTHPGSRIQKQQQKRGVKKICCHNFLCSHKFHKIANYFSFEVLKKKTWSNFQRIIELFTQKIVTKLSKIWIWDQGSGKNLFQVPDPGSRGQKGTGSRIWIRNTDLNIINIKSMIKLTRCRLSICLSKFRSSSDFSLLLNCNKI